MLPDRVLNPGPLTYESGALPITLRGPAKRQNLKERAAKTKTQKFKRKGKKQDSTGNKYLYPAYAIPVVTSKRDHCDLAVLVGYY